MSNVPAAGLAESLSLVERWAEDEDAEGLEPPRGPGPGFDVLAEPEEAAAALAGAHRPPDIGPLPTAPVPRPDGSVDPRRLVPTRALPNP